MAHNVQQLQQAGFDDGQVRALASFVGDMVRDTMRPFIERVDQRFDDMQKRVDQRFDAADQRLDDMQKRVDQRFDAADQRVNRVETRLDNLEQRAGGLGESLARLDAKVEDVRRREWVAMTMMGLGFAGLIIAILLATRIIG